MPVLRMNRMLIALPVVCLLLPAATVCNAAPVLTCADEPLLVDLWDDPAPGETTRSRGEVLPFRSEEVPPVTRITGITQPTLSVHLAPDAAVPARAVLILPGGAFRRVVVDKEGSEIAKWLNGLGISAFVLRYRTTEDGRQDAWLRPLQDAQRAMSLIRTRAKIWNVDPERIGVAGFSAGGQAAARLLCDGGRRAYPAGDSVDEQPSSPNFGILVYPWNLWNSETETLIPELEIHSKLPPIFLVHTHDDSASSLSSALFYAALRKHKVPAELHIFATGGHGYGLRRVQASNVSSWPEFAEHWLSGLEMTQGKKP